MPLSHLGFVRFVVGFSFFVSIDLLNVIGQSPAREIIKYLYLFSVLTFILYYVHSYAIFDKYSPASLIIIGFFIITVTSFTLHYLQYGSKMSYVSAFIAPLVFVVSSFVPRSAFTVDGKDIIRTLLLLFITGSIFYFFEAFAKEFSVPIVKNLAFYPVAEHVKSYFLILAISLSILTNRYKTALFIFVVLILALLVRPGSTLIVSFFVCMLITFLLKARFIRSARLITYGILLLASIGPFLLVYIPSVGQTISEVEKYVKGDLLDSNSNAMFRINIIKQAFLELDETSYIFGNGFSGDTNVFIAKQYSYWLNATPSGLAAIHSDFVIILNQSGLVGFAIFIILLFMLLGSRFKYFGNKFLGNEENDAIVSLSIIALVLLILYSSFNPFMQQYQFALVLWFVVFLSEMVRKATYVKDH